eukprot:TRINITY_DN10043_c0_g1_i1.p1 TRINITY_DN10043_c0_g1~~TRINITY_DN10043_c0_g1_i1.p1  ORF type:complete len:272 (+),score=61.47 TRINITY_DN10043_c0_g1_i1:233-1048(+)
MEVKYLQGEKANLTAQLASAREEKDEQSRVNADIVCELEARCLELEREVHEKDRLYKASLESQKTLTQSLVVHQEKEEALRKEMTAANERVAVVEREKRLLAKSEEEKSVLLNEYSTLLCKHEAESTAMADRMLDLKKELDRLEARLQIFELERVGKLGVNMKVQMVFRKNISGVYILELEYPNERVSYDATFVADLGHVKDQPNRFYINIRAPKTTATETIILESREDADQVLHKLKRFVVRAQEEYGVGETGSRKSNNLIKDVIGFFAS